jgi:hypothetical protein
MLEILSCEQPCIICGGLLEVVTIFRDPDTGEERTERHRPGHSDVVCRAQLRLFREERPWTSGF